jgi:hypothetical protein
MIFLMSTLHVLVLAFLAAAFLAVRVYQKRGRLPYPPGPRPLPLVGNLFDIPKEFSWLKYAQLSKEHGMFYFGSKATLTEGMTGDIFSFHVFGQVIVVLNSLKVTKDLLEKRGETYSERPVIPIVEMYVFSS